MNFEIVSYGGADFLRFIFNGIAMIFGYDSYRLALGAASILGLLAWMMNVAFAGGSGKTLNPGWFIGILLLFYGFLVPKVDLIIRDEVSPANSNVVGNVPFGLAATASLFSQFSALMTNATETVFSLPNGVRYTQTGVLFSSRITEEVMKVHLGDARQSLNWQDFFKNCVYYDLLLANYSWNDLASQNNLMDFFVDKTSSALQFTYTPAAGAPAISSCGGQVGTLVTELENWMDNNYAPILLTRLNNVDDPDDGTRNSQAVARYAAAMPLGITYLTGLSASASQLMQQSALLHSLRRGLSNFASDADASAAAQDFAAARAEAERKNTFLVMGEVAKKFVPIAAHIFEAIIYAVFPLVLVMAMTPLVVKVLMGYLTFLFWINLWPPLFAIINFASTYYTAMEVKSRLIYQSSGGAAFNSGYNLLTSSGLTGLLGDYAAVTGYLLVFVPMLAFMLVSRSGAMAAGLVGRLMQGYERPASSASEEATKGNIDLGNTRFDTHSAFQTNMSPEMEQGKVSYRDGLGVKQTMTGGGATSEHLHTTSALSLNHAQEETSSRSLAYQDARTETERSAASFSEQSQAALRTTFGVSNDVSRDTGISDSSGNDFSSGLSQRMDRVDTQVDAYAKREGLSLEQTSSLKAALGFDVTGIGGGGETAWRRGVDEQQEHLNQFLSQEQVRSSVDDAVNYTQGHQGQWQSRVSDSTKVGFESSSDSYHAAQSEYSVAVGHEQKAMEDWKAASVLSNAIQLDNLDALRNVLGDARHTELIHQATRGETAEVQGAAMTELSHAAMQVYQGEAYSIPAWSPNVSVVEDFNREAAAGVTEINRANIDQVFDERQTPSAEEVRWNAGMREYNADQGRADAQEELADGEQAMRKQAQAAETDSAKLQEKVEKGLPSGLEENTANPQDASLYDEAGVRRRERSM